MGLFLFSFPRALVAQGTPTLDELELAYQAAIDAHQSALSAWEVQNRRLNRLVEEANSAQASGDEDRINEAYAAAQRAALEQNRWDREVGRTAEVLREAREPYREALGRRLDELIEELRATQGPEERADLLVLVRATNNRYEALLRESAQEPDVDFQGLSEWTIQRTDTPEEIRQKADVLDSRADRFEVQLALTEERLQRFREQQRRARNIADFVADARRYDDTRPPAGPPETRATDPGDPGQILPPGADTLGIQDRPLTLEEQIQGLQALRHRLADYIERMRDRAEIFRRRAGGEWA